MMKKNINDLIITREDYHILNEYIKGIKRVTAFDSKNAGMLNEELKKARLVPTKEAPDDVVRLNSRITIREGLKDKLIDLVLVLPEHADIKSKKISVFAPIGTALLGFRQGSKVQWNVPAGKKTFTIMNVSNQVST